MVKALFFDLTGTLQNFNWNKQWSLLRIALNKNLKRKVNMDEFKRVYQQVYESYRLGKIKNDREFFDLVFRQLGWNVSKGQMQKIIKQHLTIRKNFTWLPKDYDKVLKELGKDFKLALVSSCCRTWAEWDYRHIFGFDLKKHFNLVYTSQDAGYLKESGRLFDYALKRLRLKKTEAAFMDDSYESILIAKRYGLKTILLNSKKGGKENIRIKSFNELLKIKNKLKRL